MTYLLLIDTAHPTAAVALVKQDRIVDQDTWTNTPQISRELLHRIGQMMTRKSLLMSDIKRIAFHGGPGSYSMLRSGATVAALLSLTTGAELVQVTGDTLVEMTRAAKIARPRQNVTLRYTL